MPAASSRCSEPKCSTRRSTIAPGRRGILPRMRSPRGLRILGKIPRLPGAIVDRLVEHFGSLQRLLAAGIDDLMAVDGVGELRARTVREGLSRLAESSILERYV